jgi:hypothetical protein
MAHQAEHCWPLAHRGRWDSHSKSQRDDAPVDVPAARSKWSAIRFPVASSMVGKKDAA